MVSFKGNTAVDHSYGFYQNHATLLTRIFGPFHNAFSYRNSCLQLLSIPLYVQFKEKLQARDTTRKGGSDLRNLILRDWRFGIPPCRIPASMRHLERKIISRFLYLTCVAEVSCSQNGLRSTSSWPIPLVTRHFDPRKAEGQATRFPGKCGSLVQLLLVLMITALPTTRYCSTIEKVS